MSTALLIIDVQHEFFSATPSPHDADAIIARINALAARAHARSVPVIVIQHSDAWGPAVGSPGWQLDARLQPGAATAFVRKATPDSFHETDLKALLGAHGVRRLAICGYATEFCIESSTRRALALGYDVDLLSDAHTTEDKDHLAAPAIVAHHNATLACVGGFPGRITLVAAADLFTEI